MLKNTVAPGAKFLPPVPRGPPNPPVRRVDQPGLLRFEQVGRATRHLGGPQLLEELQVVQHPETTSERGEHDRMLLGLNSTSLTRTVGRLSPNGCHCWPPSRLKYTVALVPANRRLDKFGSWRTLSTYWSSGSPVAISCPSLP